jgi:hypothetical protein
MIESGIGKTIMLALSRVGVMIFRNNVAQGVVGRTEWIREKKQVWVNPGDCIVRNGRVLHAGLFKGSGDYIGITTVVVTPEMVGSKVGVFTSIEAKAGTKSTPEQKNWHAAVVAAGGFSGEARSAEDALTIVGKG